MCEATSQAGVTLARILACNSTIYFFNFIFERNIHTGLLRTFVIVPYIKILFADSLLFAKFDTLNKT